MIQKHIFQGGLNLDDDPRYVKPGDYVNGQNISVLSEEDTTTGNVHNIYGNEVIAAAAGVLSAGDNTVIGSLGDDANDQVIYFIHNSNGDHKIIRYKISDDTCAIVLQQSNFAAGQNGLNFSTSKLITGIAMAGDICLFTDNNSQPWRVNIERYITANAGTPPTTYTDDMFTLIRKQPRFAPQGLVKQYDTTYPSNFIKGKAFQFATRYRFKDKEVSVVGPWSPIVACGQETDLENNVFISLYFGGGSNAEPITEDIEQVELIVRYGNTGEAYTIKTFDVTTSTATLTHHFFNDQYGIPLGADADKIADNVPEKCAALEIARNRTVLGNIETGKDTPTTTSLTAQFTSSTTLQAGDRAFKSASKRQLGIVFRDFAGRPCGVVTNESLKFIVPHSEINPTEFYSTLDWTLSNASATSEIPEWATTYELFWTKDLVNQSFIQGISGGVFYVEKENEVYTKKSRVWDAKKVAIRIDISCLDKYKIGYTFTEGDVIRLYWRKKTGTSGGLATFTNTYKEFRITEFDGRNVYIKVEKLDTGFESSDVSSTDFQFEIYTPALQENNQLFYGTGIVYNITNPGTLSRVYSDTSGSLPGDVFLLNRTRSQIIAPIYGHGRSTQPLVRGTSSGFGPFNVFTASTSAGESGFIADIDKGTGGYFRDSGSGVRDVYFNSSAATLDASMQITIPYNIVPHTNFYTLTFEVQILSTSTWSSSVDRSIASEKITQADARSGTVVINVPRQILPMDKAIRVVYTLSNVTGGTAIPLPPDVELFGSGKPGTWKVCSPDDDSLYEESGYIHPSSIYATGTKTALQTITTSSASPVTSIVLFESEVDAGSYFTPAGADSYFSPGSDTTVNIIANVGYVASATSNVLGLFADAATFKFELVEYNSSNVELSVLASQTVRRGSGNINIVFNNKNVLSGRRIKLRCTATRNGASTASIQLLTGAKFIFYNPTAAANSNGPTFLAEVMSLDDTVWSKWERDLGKPNVVTKLGKVVRQNQCVFSNVFIQNTQINGLSTFDILDFFDTDDACGPIAKLVYTSKVNNVGNVLLAICKTETNSIYIGEAQISDQSGSSILAQTNGYIGGINVLAGSFGTIHPESVREEDGNVYWFDANKGMVVRYSRAGLDPVSQVKVSSFFTKRTRDMISQSLKVIACTNNNTGEYLVVMPKVDDRLISYLPDQYELDQTGTATP